MNNAINVIVKSVKPSELVETKYAVDASLVVDGAECDVTLCPPEGNPRGPVGTWGTLEHWLSNGAVCDRFRSADEDTRYELETAIVRAVREAAKHIDWS